MPPKKQQKGSSKADQKKKEKIIEDKTFGLKNKKGSKQQKFVKQVNQQVKYGGDASARKLEQQKQDEKKKKELDKKKQAEMDSLFRPAIAQTRVGKGADPKSVLCAFFKQGQCTKGDKCKFSHDLAVERKGEKRSLYADTRDEGLENDTMDTWDDDKLKAVVEKKHGEGNKQKNKTDIVCKYFIQAIEDKKYGWFWTCPNGNSCIYRHALPPGFVLKSDKKMMEEQKEKISIEDLIEKERAALGSKVTKVTLESFLAWKKRKKAEKIKAMKAKKDKRQKDFKSGKCLGVSGREVFEFQPELIGEDDADADDVTYTREVEREESDVAVRGVSDDMFIPEEVDASGTQATSDRLPTPASTGEGKSVDAPSSSSPEAGGDSSQTPSTSGIKQNGLKEKEEDIAVDENLFTEDLDDLDEELNELDI